MFCLRTLRELKLLKFLSEAGVSENVRDTLTTLHLRAGAMRDAKRGVHVHCREHIARGTWPRTKIRVCGAHPVMTDGCIATLPVRIVDVR